MRAHRVPIGLGASAVPSHPAIARGQGGMARCHQIPQYLRDFSDMPAPPAPPFTSNAVRASNTMSDGYVRRTHNDNMNVASRGDDDALARGKRPSRRGVLRDSTPDRRAGPRHPAERYRPADEDVHERAAALQRRLIARIDGPAARSARLGAVTSISLSAHAVERDLYCCCPRNRHPPRRAWPVVCSLESSRAQYPRHRLAALL